MTRESRDRAVRAGVVAVNGLALAGLMALLTVAVTRQWGATLTLLAVVAVGAAGAWWLLRIELSEEEIDDRP